MKITKEKYVNYLQLFYYFNKTELLPSYDSEVLI